MKTTFAGPGDVQYDRLLRVVIRDLRDETPGDDQVVAEVLQDLLVGNRIDGHGEWTDLARGEHEGFEHERLANRPSRERRARGRQRDYSGAEKSEDLPHAYLLGLPACAASIYLCG